MAADTTRVAQPSLPRVLMAVDVALLTVLPGAGPSAPLRLGVVVVHPDGGGDPQGWRLPGVLVGEGELLADAVRRAVRDKAGLADDALGGRSPEQLRVFDAVGRDTRSHRSVSVAHRATVRWEEVPARSRGHAVAVAVVEDGPRAALPDGTDHLAYDHDDVLAVAVEDLRRRYAADPDPGLFLDDVFTVRELRRVHEAVAGHSLQPDTFRRHVRHALEVTDAEVRGGVGRPAPLVRRLPPEEWKDRTVPSPTRSAAARAR